ncbi:unnamed protein product [Lathyrus sativus]|nr:unnamed protein product [Lathyrus sativus]
MNVLAYNIHECGNSIKRNRIKKLLISGNVDICFIQETKKEKMDNGLFHFGKKGFEWSTTNAIGIFEGILTIWKKDIIYPISSFRGKVFLGINSTWKGLNCYFVNIYSPCNLHNKRILWSYLINLRSSSSYGEWLVSGDFDVVKRNEERHSRTACCTAEMNEFCSFIDAMRLVDLPDVGNCFTWFNSSGSCRSRLDRFLLSDGLIDSWKISAQCMGDKDVSDHRPVWIKANHLNWGPKPFKVFKCRFDHPDFHDFVKKIGNSSHFVGSAAHVLAKKLKKYETAITVVE